MALARRYSSKALPHFETNFFVLVENFSAEIEAEDGHGVPCPYSDYLEYNSTISCSLNAGV
jgi:hypothetical protein